MIYQEWQRRPVTITVGTLERTSAGRIVHQERTGVEEVDARVRGPFAIHGEDSSYRVTHIPTGLLIAGGIRTFEKAKRFCREIEDCCDWQAIHAIPAEPGPPPVSIMTAARRAWQ